MIELETSRMNFLRQGRAAFTYRTMGKVLIAWGLLLAVAYGAGILWEIQAKRSVVQAKAALEQLNTEKDAQIQSLEAFGRERVGASAREDLAAILSHRPEWSQVLRQLARSMPAQVWLSSLKVLQEKGANDQLEITGYAKSQRELTNFMMRLESGGYFRRTQLGGTKSAEGMERTFEYDIVTTPVFSKFRERADG